MSQVVAVSEVRRQLHRLLEAVRRHPDQRYDIAVHGTVVAQLMASPSVPSRGSAAKALLRLSRPLQRPRHRPKRLTRVSEDHDRYLYQVSRPRG